MAEKLSADQLVALRRASDRVNGQGWGLAFGVLAGTTLFLATVLLVVRGGHGVGLHLGLLGIYLPGYDVTWPGAFIGAIEAFVLAYAAGRVAATIYNRLADH